MNGIRTRDLGIDAQGEPLLLAAKAVPEAPPLSATRRNLEVQALPIGESPNLLTGLRISNRSRGQRHWGQLQFVGPELPPKLPPVAPGSHRTYSDPNKPQSSITNQFTKGKRPF